MSEADSNSSVENGPYDDETVVIGREHASALAAERRHRQAHGGSSPLAGVGYDFWKGEFDLYRFVDSAADEAVRSLVKHFDGTGDHGRAEIRAALTMDDFYT